MKSHLRPVMVGLTLLMTAACSLSEGEQVSADSLSRALVTDSTPKVEKANADCVAEKFLGEVGVDGLTDAGLLDKKGEAVVSKVRRALTGAAKVNGEINTSYADAWLACVDFDEVALTQKKAHPKASAEDLDELADCLKEVDRSTWERAGMRLAPARNKAIRRCSKTLKR